MNYINFDELVTSAKLDTDDFKRNHLINKILYWSGSDKEHDFKKRIKKEGLNSPNVKYYINNPISYQYNNFGYRTYDDFNQNDKGVVTLGCSFTEGIGLHLEHTWSYRISKNLNKKFWNLGVGGFGLDRCYYNLLFFIDYLLFDDIFLLIPPKFRFCFHRQSSTADDSWIDYRASELLSHKESNQMLFTSETNEFLRQLAYLHSIKYLATKKNKNLFVLDSAVVMPPNEMNYNEYNFGARDNHLSPNLHLFWYDKFMEKYYNSK